MLCSEFLYFLSKKYLFVCLRAIICPEPAQALVRPSPKSLVRPNQKYCICIRKMGVLSLLYPHPDWEFCGGGGLRRLWIGLQEVSQSRHQQKIALNIISSRADLTETCGTWTRPRNLSAYDFTESMYLKDALFFQYHIFHKHVVISCT